MKIKQAKVIDIIGAPISVASAHKGASLGPDAIRIAGLKKCLHYLEHEYIDSGNLPSLEEPYPPKYFVRLVTTTSAYGSTSWLMQAASVSSITSRNPCWSASCRRDCRSRDVSSGLVVDSHNTAAIFCLLSKSVS